MLKLAFSRTCDLGTHTHTNTLFALFNHSLLAFAVQACCFELGDSKFSAPHSLSLSSLELKVLQTHAELLQK